MFRLRQIENHKLFIFSKLYCKMARWSRESDLTDDADRFKSVKEP